MEPRACALSPFKPGRRKLGIQAGRPQTWTVSYKELTFKVSPTGFKHTGLFPEQAVNWDWMQSKIRKAKADGPAGPDPEPVRLHRRSDDGVRQRRGR